MGIRKTHRYLIKYERSVFVSGRKKFRAGLVAQTVMEEPGFSPPFTLTALSIVSAAPWALHEHSGQIEGQSVHRQTCIYHHVGCWPGLGHMALAAATKSGKLRLLAGLHSRGQQGEAMLAEPTHSICHVAPVQCSGISGSYLDLHS